MANRNSIPSSRVLVELVDGQGRTVGLTDKHVAHRAPGLRHRAFSVFLFDDKDELLLQRRAAGKYHSPGVWSNSCCGHPLPGGDPRGAALGRARHELGVELDGLRASGTVSYEYSDPLTGMVEREYNHLYVGRVRSRRLRPDASEVSDVRWVNPGALSTMRSEVAFSEWFETVLDAAVPRFARGRSGIDLPGRPEAAARSEEA